MNREFCSDSLEFVGTSALGVQLVNVVGDQFVDDGGILVGYQTDGKFTDHFTWNDSLTAVVAERTLNT